MSITNLGVYINGNFVSFDELQADVNSAIKKGLQNQWAFCPETVQALLDFISTTCDIEIKGA